MEQNKNEKLRNSIYDELKEFKESNLKLSAEDIYYNAYNIILFEEICFKVEDMLNEDSLDESFYDVENLINKIFEFFIENNYQLTENEVEECIEEFVNCIKDEGDN